MPATDLSRPDPPIVKVDGAVLADAVKNNLLSVRVEARMSVPAVAEVRFADPGFTIVDGTTFTVGKPITVTGGGSTVVFDGEIVALAVDHNPDTVTELVITAYDKGHRLGHKSSVQVFQSQSYSAAISTIAGNYGLSATVDSSLTTPTHEFIVAAVNDYAFLNDIAFRTGTQWWVEGATLHFAPRASGAAVVIGKDDIKRCRVRHTAAERSTDVVVRSWDPATKAAIVQTDTASAAAPASPVVTTATIGSSNRTGASTFAGPRTLRTLPAATQAEATALAKGIGTRIAAAETSLRVEVRGKPALKPGSIIDLQDVGTKLAGEYYVTSVEHIWDSRDYITRVETGALDPTGLVDLLGGAPSPVTELGRVGLVVGVVTNNNDPNGQGRVKVKVPAFDDQTELPWARVMSLGANATTGLVVTPEVNDEVLVGFEHGDLRRPLVLGGVWGGVAKPPIAKDVTIANNKVAQWSMVTGGHKLILRGADAAADKHMKLTLSDNATILYVGADKIEVISNDKPIEVKNSQGSMLVAANGDITLKAPNITLDATTKVTIKAPTIEAKGSAVVKVESSATLELKASSLAKLESTGMTEIKGSMVKVN